MAREAETKISFSRVVEITKRIKRISGQARETTSDKSPHYFRGFRSASFGDKVSFFKGHPIRPVQSALQVTTHGTFGNQNPYGSRFEKLEVSAPSFPVSTTDLELY